MTNLQLSQAQGQLMAAVSSGGVEALWRMAGSSGPTSDLARLALELLTSPFSELTAMEAVNEVIRSN